jgi:hypothetical protein
MANNTWLDGKYREEDYDESYGELISVEKTNEGSLSVSTFTYEHNSGVGQIITTEVTTSDGNSSKVIITGTTF